MTEPKPPYTVNPAVLPIAPEFMTAINETARLLQDAISTIAPLSGRDTIMVNYHDWDTKCNTLAAIREKCSNWETVTPSTTLYAFSLFREISDLLKKAGY